MNMRCGPRLEEVGHARQTFIGDDRRSDRERLGEALFFTGSMAPASSGWSLRRNEPITSSESSEPISSIA